MNAVGGEFGRWQRLYFLLTACKQKKKSCDDEAKLHLQKQIESVFLLKKLHSSLECRPCGAKKQPSALQRRGPTTSLELFLQCEKEMSALARV